MKFEWDKQKADTNFKKHGVSFHEAASVFGDILSITYPDPDHSVRENSFITVGISRFGRVLIISHTDRGNNIRIINARKTTRKERKYYEEGK
jgi:uncharacterized DUF497 family protein